MNIKKFDILFIINTNSEKKMENESQPQIKGKFTTCKLVKREDLTHDLIKFWLEPKESFNFKPGQYCTIGTGGIERPYSIVSSPDEKNIELFIEVVPPPDGNLTPLLHELSVGAEMTLRPRGKGIFVIQPQFKNHIFVGTVTGVVPYVSMLRKFLNDTNWPEPEKMENVKREDYQFHVLEGASYSDEFGYDDELTQLSKEHDFIHFYPSVSRPDEEKNSDWKGAKGRINNLVEDYITKLGINPKETCIYACGHPQMIEDVEKRFSDTDFTFLEERFWKDDD